MSTVNKINITDNELMINIYNKFNIEKNKWKILINLANALYQDCYKNNELKYVVNPINWLIDEDNMRLNWGKTKDFFDKIGGVGCGVSDNFKEIFFVNDTCCRYYKFMNDNFPVGVGKYLLNFNLNSNYQKLTNIHTSISNITNMNNLISENA